MPLSKSINNPGAAGAFSNRLIVLDRDGVINQDSDDYIKSAQEWHAIPGSLEAIARLNHAGWRVVVATNQSGIGRGLFDFEALGGIHDKMQRQLAEFGGRIDAVFYCPHTPDDACDCRKPKPGMLRDIGRRFQMDMQGVPLIGDSARDLKAAVAIGARPMLVRTGNGAGNEEAIRQEIAGVEVFDDLAAAVANLLDGNKSQ